MKFARKDDKRIEASKGAKGFCPFCDSELVAKCGEINVNHWAHKGNRNCDPWWENETDWHRNWKDNFPVEWQEFIHQAENGEKHIADVKTDQFWALEFQHSYLKPDERRARNAFYPKLVWVVDGSRRKTDKPQFQKAISESSVVKTEPLILRVIFPEECRLLKEWHENNALIFFDFQKAKESKQSILWFLFPKTSDSEAYLSPFSRINFIKLHNNNEFDALISDKILQKRNILAKNQKIQRQNELRNLFNGMSGFRRYQVNKQRKKDGCKLLKRKIHV